MHVVSCVQHPVIQANSPQVTLKSALERIWNSTCSTGGHSLGNLSRAPHLSFHVSARISLLLQVCCRRRVFDCGFACEGLRNLSLTAFHYQASWCSSRLHFANCSKWSGSDFFLVITARCPVNAHRATDSGFLSKCWRLRSQKLRASGSSRASLSNAALRT